MIKKYLLHDAWKFSIKKTSEEIPAELRNKLKEDKWYAARVPGNIQTDLLNNKLIPDPFYADNENKLQWIGKQSWVYKTVFDFPEEFEAGKNIFIVMEGIDTSAIVIVNGTMAGVMENMFCTYKFEIAKHLKKGKNELEIFFTSPEIYAKQLEVKYGKLPVELRSERVYIRKAQYSFGWDWGPAFLTQGIWRPIYLLQTDEYYFENFSFNTISIDEQNSKAKIKIQTTINKTVTSKLKLNINLSDGNSAYEFSEDVVNTDNLSKEYNLDDIKLWWCNGYGEPHLYNLKIQLICAEEILDEVNKKVGIRTVKLLLEEEGKNVFRFSINGHPVFAKGADWIPGDSFLPRVNKEKYLKLISLAEDANMNILRVWGGGIYEDDIFYEYCDELGLMVWQDFMFACSSYPEHKDFLENVSEEVHQNVYRLKNHPCIIIWCGNNENEWIWNRSFKKSYKEMPGYKIYHDLIPSILSEIDGDRPYWQSTPFGNDEDPNSESSGNRHQWDIWSNWVDYNKVVNDKSLFVSEFGFQAPANAETLLNILPKSQRHPQSKIFEFHNKQVEGPERLTKFLSAHLPLTNKLEEYIYLTQLNQGFALKKCVEHWQSRFPETNGTIIWQINDVWPVSSWALIDSNVLPKLAYYFVKQSFNAQIVLFSQTDQSVNISVQNNSIKKFLGKIKIQKIELPNGKVHDVTSKKIILESLEKRVVYSIQNSAANNNLHYVIVVSLYNNEGIVTHQNYFVNEEWKHLRLPKAKVKYQRTKNNSVILKTNKPAFFVALTGSEAMFSKNGFILLPNENVEIKLLKQSSKSKMPKTIDIRCLNEFLS